MSSQEFAAATDEVENPRVISLLSSRYPSFSDEDGGAEDQEDPETRQSSLLVEERLMQFCENQGHDNASTTPETHHKLVKRFSLSKLPHAFPCKDTYQELPSPPSQWPQCPLMIRPTPDTSTKIKGIRHVSSNEYKHFAGFCAGCILPINNGTEPKGESLVIDFESNHFVGTMLMRIQQAPPVQSSSTTNIHNKSYFDGKKRKFQAVVQGRFKTALPMSQCVTGQIFERPAGKLPAKWIVTSFIKFVSTLAPQLQADLGHAKPRFLTPLVATAHTVIVEDSASSNNNPEAPELAGYYRNLEQEMVEPPATDPSSVMHNLGHDTTHRGSTPAPPPIAKRMKLRKKAFNKIAAKKKVDPVFSTTKVYSFEFYQHLLDFGTEGLAVDMGRPIGHVGLASITDGQPIKFMSAHQDPTTKELDSLWSFDIWHESLHPLAVQAYE